MASIDANAITVQLQKAGLPITSIIVYTASTDPNNLLGRPNGYLSKTAFKDTRCTPGDDPGSISDGGGIEVFPDQASAQARAAYIEGIAKALPILNEYDYVSGNALLRLSTQLTPDEAGHYKEIFEKIMGG